MFICLYLLARPYLWTKLFCVSFLVLLLWLFLCHIIWLHGLALVTVSLAFICPTPPLFFSFRRTPFCSAAGLQTSCLLSFTRSQRNPCMHSLGVRELAPHVYHFLTFGFVVFFDWHTAPLPPFVLLLLLSVVNERE